MARKEKKEKSKEGLIPKTSLDILPLRSYDEQAEGFVLEDGSYLDILEILGKDQSNMQEDELRYDVYNMARLWRLYLPDHKDVSINFPLNTGRQRKYWEKKLEETADPIRRKWAVRRLDELLTVDKNIERREFYRIIFADNADLLIKNKDNLLGWAGSGRGRQIVSIPKEKKFQLAKKLCNMNTMILLDDLEGGESSAQD